MDIVMFEGLVFEFLFLHDFYWFLFENVGYWNMCELLQLKKFYSKRRRLKRELSWVLHILCNANGVRRR